MWGLTHTGAVTAVSPRTFYFVSREFVPGCWLVDLYFINNYGFRDSRDRQRQTHDDLYYPLR